MEKLLDIDNNKKLTPVLHGAYNSYMLFEIVQHEYAGGGPEEGGWGYVEVLEIKNPPNGRWGIVIHNRTSDKGSVFTEWETVKDARAAFAKTIYDNTDTYPKLPGFKRRVVCGIKLPWFYTDQEPSSPQ